MSDDKLKKMLDDALESVAAREGAQKTAKQKEEEETRASGLKLRDLVLPRLQAAQKAWDGKLKLDIIDNSGKVSLGGQQRITPSISVSATGKEHAGYVFVTHSPGYASIQEGVGSRRGGNVYEFQVTKLEDLTEAKVDEILQDLVALATGLKSRR